MEKEQDVSKKKNNGIVTVITIFIFFAIIGAICGIFTNSSEDGQKPVNTPTDEEQINYTYCNIGEEFLYDDLKITINKFSRTGEIYSGGHYIYPGAYNTWYVLDAKINNTSNQRKQLSGLFGSITYFTSLIIVSENGDETRYNSTYYTNSDFIGNYEEILAHGTIAGMYLYRVPGAAYSETSKLYWEFGINKKTCKDYVRVILN